MLEVSVQSACWWNENDPEWSFRFIRDCGFEGIDYSMDNHLIPDAICKGDFSGFFEQSVEELKEHYRPIKAAAEKYGVRFAQMHGPFPMRVKGMDMVEPNMIAVTEKVLEIAKFLDCPAVVVHPTYRTLKAEEWETNFRIYRALIPAAKRTGVKVCLENLFSNYKDHVIEGPCSDAVEACRYIDTLNAEAGENCFGFCFDVGHANLVGRNIRQYLNILGDRLTVLHIHDNNGATDGHMLPYTQTYRWGTNFYLDWEGLIEGLRDIGYRGPLNFETFRALLDFPKPTRPAMLKLVASIGEYFKARILGEE